MALVKSVAAGAAASLLIANVVHREIGQDGGVLGIVDTTVLEHRVAWSWSVFTVVTVAVWLLTKAANHASSP